MEYNKADKRQQSQDLNVCQRILMHWAFICATDQRMVFDNILTCCEQIAVEWEGVLTFMRLPHDSGKVPVKLLLFNAMVLSCSTDTSMSYKNTFAQSALYQEQSWAWDAVQMLLTDVMHCNYAWCMIWNMCGMSVWQVISLWLHTTKLGLHRITILRSQQQASISFDCTQHKQISNLCNLITKCRCTEHATIQSQC